MGDRNFSDTSLSSHTLEKVKKAKVTIETFYSNLVNQHIERENRIQALEKSMTQEGVSDEQVSINYQTCLVFSIYLFYGCHKFKVVAKKTGSGHFCPDTKYNYFPQFD